MTKEELLTLRDKFLTLQKEHDEVEARFDDLKNTLIEYFLNDYFYQRSRVDPKWSHSARQKIKVTYEVPFREILPGWINISHHSIISDEIGFMFDKLRFDVSDNYTEYGCAPDHMTVEIPLDELFEPIDSLVERHTKEYLNHLAKVEQDKLDQIRRDELAQLKRLKEKYPNE